MSNVCGDLGEETDVIVSMSGCLDDPGDPVVMSDVPGYPGSVVMMCGVPGEACCS